MDIQSIYAASILVLLAIIFFGGIIISSKTEEPLALEIEPIDNDGAILRETIKALQNCRNDFNAACREYCVPREKMAARPEVRGIVEEYNRARAILSQSFDVEVPSLTNNVDVRA